MKKLITCGIVGLIILIFMTFYWTRYQVAASSDGRRFMKINRWTGAITIIKPDGEYPVYAR
jgi:hypothetical protein